MPSLKFSNLIRRRADAPSLKDRAAALKASAARVMRRRPSAAAPLLIATSVAPVGADPQLLAMVAELLEARRKLNDPSVPDGPEADALGDRETDLPIAVHRFPARSIHDMAAKLPTRTAATLSRPSAPPKATRARSSGCAAPIATLKPDPHRRPVQ